MCQHQRYDLHRAMWTDPGHLNESTSLVYDRLPSRQGFFPPVIVPECSLRVQTTHRAVVHHLQVYFVPHKLTDVVDAILDHGGPVVKSAICKLQFMYTHKIYIERLTAG